MIFSDLKHTVDNTERRINAVIGITNNRPAAS